jgi:hypothetical protein
MKCSVDDWGSAELRANVSYGMFVAAGAVAVVDVVLWALDAKRARRAETATRLRLAPALGGVALTGRF